MTVGLNDRHSGLGIAGLVSLGAALLVAAMILMVTAVLHSEGITIRNSGCKFDSFAEGMLFTFFGAMSFFFVLLGLVFGVGGVLQRDRKKLLAILALIISILLMIPVVLSITDLLIVANS